MEIFHWIFCLANQSQEGVGLPRLLTQSVHSAQTREVGTQKRNAKPNALDHVIQFSSKAADAIFVQVVRQSAYPARPNGTL